METNRLRQFLVVARMGSVRAAAEVLHISPGGLSKSLATFEHEMRQGALFRRDGRSLVLTDKGRDIEARSDLFLQAFDRFKTGEHAPEETAIRISTFEVFSTYFLSRYVSMLSGPPEVRCSESIPGQLETDVATRVSDIGITYEPIPMPGIEFLKIARIRMGVFGRKQAFVDLPFAEWSFAAPKLPVTHAPTGVKGLDGWPDDRYPRRIKFAVDMMETAIGLARRGSAVVHLPAFVAAFHNDVIQKPLHLEELDSPAKSVYRWVYLVRRMGSSEDKTVKQLAKSLRELSKF